MDTYRDKDMGDVIVGKPFCRVVCVEAKRFDRFITIHDGFNMAEVLNANEESGGMHIIWNLMCVAHAGMSEAKDVRSIVNEYLTKIRHDSGPEIVKPLFEENIKFEFCGQCIEELKENVFYGKENEDPHEHISNITEIIDLFHLPGVSRDQVMLMAFPFTLKGKAKQWMKQLSTRSIKTWDLFGSTFLDEYRSPLKIIKEIETIRNFKQEPNEPLHCSWERFTESLFSCPEHKLNKHEQLRIFYQWLDTETRRKVDFKGPIPRMTPTKGIESIKKLSEHSLSWYGTSMEGRISNLEVSLNSFIKQSLRRQKESENMVREAVSLLSSTETNPRGLAHAITTRSGLNYKPPRNPLENNTKDKHVTNETIPRNEEVPDGHKNTVESCIPPIPFLGRLKKKKEKEQFKKSFENLQQLSINIPFVKALEQMPTYAKFMKDLITKKGKAKETSKITLNERCYAFIFPVDFVMLDIGRRSQDSDNSRKTVLGHRSYDDRYESDEIERNLKKPNTSGLSSNQNDWEPNDFIKPNLFPASTREADAQIPKLKELPSHLEYAFMKDNQAFPVIISYLTKRRMQPQRRLNPKVQDVLKAKIVKLLDTGLIYAILDSLWVSPIHVVPKKGGMTVITNKNNELVPTRTVIRWRVCIDCRKLNDATRKDHFPLPFINQMLERLSGNEYYCFLDGFSGYFQILLAQEDQEKTTFTCPYGTYAYRRMPFRLCNASVTFQRCMTAIFHDMCNDFMEVFMDDFFVFCNSFDSCLTNLSKMLARCKETNLVLNWEKYHFMVKEGIVLGHKISKSSIEIDKAKVDVIAKLPYPTNVKGVRSFLGHARFYRRFIKDFSKIARPMTQLLMKDAKFVFLDECMQAFNVLKDKLTTAPVIVAPNWNLDFELMCNASNYAIGPVLGKQIDKKFHPIYYASKTMNASQEHYTTIKKELLAVVYAFDKFRSYLIMSKTVVYTDHSALKYLFSKQDAKPMPIRWIRKSETGKLNKEAIHDFPDEHLIAIHVREAENDPWCGVYAWRMIGKGLELHKGNDYVRIG
ncbi:putative nucleotidyltransferase, ribonuclease H [Tanacetum coccineum]